MDWIHILGRKNRIYTHFKKPSSSSVAQDGTIIQDCLANEKAEKNNNGTAPDCPNCCQLKWIGVLTHLRDALQYDATYLQQNSADGCIGCRLLLQAINGLAKDDLEVKSVTLHRSLNGAPMDVTFWMADDSTRSFEFFTHHERPAIWPGFGPARCVSTNSSSPSCFSLAAGWLSQCLATHEYCRTKSDSNDCGYLPHRILDVGSTEDTIYLRETDGQTRDVYVALSYCWGSEGQSMQVRTTSDTIEENKQAIYLSSLPLTLQHAVCISRGLNLQYLWVDSLCIIQDSKSDWDIESAKMGDIFANSIVTISADGSSSCDGGCFIASPYRNLTILELPCPGFGGERSKIYVRKSGFRQACNGSRATKTLDRPKIDTRAWTLQERLLAPRVLHFTSTELVWQCATEVNCECQVSKVESNKSVFRPFRDRYIQRNTAFENNRGVVWSVLREGLRFDWRSIVSEYTQREMSIETDRLAAISGLAAAMARTKTKGYQTEDYFFGLWRQDIVRNLLWYAVYGDGDPFDDFKPRSSRRLEELYAPSWSWASITGQVAYYDEVSQEDRSETMLVPKIHTLDMIYTLQSENPYGPGMGMLVLAGELIPVTVRQDAAGKHIVQTADFISTSKKEIGDVHLDVLDSDQKEYSEDELLYWLIVAEIVSQGRSSVKDQGTRPIGPLLKMLTQRNEQPSKYWRIGLVLGHLWFAQWDALYESIRQHERLMEKKALRKLEDHRIDALKNLVSGPQVVQPVEPKLQLSRTWLPKSQNVCIL